MRYVVKKNTMSVNDIHRAVKGLIKISLTTCDFNFSFFSSFLLKFSWIVEYSINTFRVSLCDFFSRKKRKTSKFDAQAIQTIGLFEQF